MKKIIEATTHYEEPIPKIYIGDGDKYISRGERVHALRKPTTGGGVRIQTHDGRQFVVHRKELEDVNEGFAHWLGEMDFEGTLKSSVSESIEQIDELSASVLQRYVKKATDDINRKGDLVNYKIRKAIALRNKGKNIDSTLDAADALSKKARERKNNVKRALFRVHSFDESNSEGENFETQGQKDMYDFFMKNKEIVDYTSQEHPTENFRDFMIRKLKERGEKYNPPNSMC